MLEKKIPGPMKSRKRLRGAPTAATHENLRAFLSSRLSEIRASPASADAGAGDAEASFRNLGCSINAALQSISGSFEAARVKLREARAALHAAVDARCDELEMHIASIETAKASALERELVAADGAFELWQSEHTDLSRVLVAACDSELDAQHDALLSRLHGLEALLKGLPPIVEPPCVGLLTDLPAMLSSIAEFGHLVCLPAVTAINVVPDDMPAHVQAGRTVLMRLSLGGDRCAGYSAAELEVLLGRLAQNAILNVALESEGRPLQVLAATLVPDPSGRCLQVSVPVPAVHGAAAVVIESITLARAPVPGTPLRIRVAQGLQTPLCLSVSEYGDNFLSAPCISDDGRIYAPWRRYPKYGVRVRDATGGSLGGVPIAVLGFIAGSLWAAFDTGPTPSLLLAQRDSHVHLLAAVDPTTYAPRWKRALMYDRECRGLAALPSHGIVLALGDSRIQAFRLSDGEKVGSLEAPGLTMFLAADPVSGAVFVGGCEPSSAIFTVVASAWLGGGATGGRGGHFSPLSFVPAARLAGGYRPIAVVPPGPGKAASHLVVGTTGEPELLVLALPSLALVHEHRLEGVRVYGLAADPCGAALVVCDGAASAVHVLAWPLPGMPPLE